MPAEIIFIHPGKANYPEISAYKKYSQDKFTVRDLSIDQFKNEVKSGKNYSSSILWYIMGFYPKHVPAKFIIHDYRSLSVGKFATLKDKVKRHFNFRPNLRIFLNESVKKQMGFGDNVPSILLNMGIPENILNYREQPQEYLYDFCYIGAISKERGADKMIRNFLDAYSNKKTLLLIGKDDDGLGKIFEVCPNITFCGLLPQEKVFPIVQQCEFGVCYLPNKQPYCYQTPTKILEYAALGKKIIANKCSFNTLEKIGINAFIAEDNKFPSVEELAKIKDNKEFDASSILWKNIIKNSGIEKFINNN